MIAFAPADRIWVFRSIRSFIFKGDHIMTVAENIRRDSFGLKVRDRDARIMLGYAIFSMAFLVLIYAASTFAGTAAADFASMSAFP
jgi:hypothetical protein